MAGNGKVYFAAYGKRTFLQGSSAAILDTTSIFFSLLFFGFGIFWTVVAIFGSANSNNLHLGGGELYFQLVCITLSNYSNLLSSLATMDMAAAMYSYEMDSPVCRTLSAVLLICLAIDYFICWGFTIYAVIKGQLLWRKQVAKPDYNNEMVHLLEPVHDSSVI
jgi:tellurite resistance protein TehA-like permease